MFKFLKKLKDMRKKSKYLYRSMGGAIAEQSNTPDMPYATSVLSTWESNPKEVKQDTRIEKKPVEVVNEIVGETPKVNLNLDYLDKQLKTVERRRKILREELDVKSTSDEDLAISFLEARIKLVKCKANFSWAVTNEDKLNDLCKKYKLQRVGFQGYYRNIPMEAIDELEKYTKLHKQVTKYAPELSLIVDVGGKEQKKDPILLIKSPFGNWYFILGAWDKEVEVVDELVYKGK